VRLSRVAELFGFVPDCRTTVTAARLQAAPGEASIATPHLGAHTVRDFFGGRPPKVAILVWFRAHAMEGGILLGLVVGAALALVVRLPRRDTPKADQWQATLAGMPDGLMVLDAALRLVEWNQHFPEFVGVPAEVLWVGMPLEDILRVQAIAGEFGLVNVEVEVRRRIELIKSGGSTGTIERKRPNGQTMELRRSPLPDGGFVTLYTDISSRRRAEDQLRQAQKMEAIGQLTGGVAHDFNNLLTVVLGNLEMAQHALETSNLLRAQRKIEEAQGGARRGAALTQHLLAFSRQQNLKPQPIDANKIVSEMSELIRHALGTIELETVLAGDLWQAILDPNQLENVLLNLALNARDAMPNGGKVTIETANSYLDAAYAAVNENVSPGQYVLISVSDCGTGMPQADVARAFEPFFTTKGVGKGSGLGLSQVFGFIKQSNGHVKIYSELGAGTTVKLYLPKLLSERSEEFETAAPRFDHPRAHDQETVLVVEDDADVMAYAMEALESLGYLVIATKDAASALTALDRHPQIVLLFTDVVMPGMNGPELAQEVLGRRPDLAVLYTTGYPVNAIAHRHLLRPEAAIISKPFALAELSAAVRDAIDQRTNTNMD
jgi:signal transduction histidine kinase/CheY-like chemotaxis protein